MGKFLKGKNSKFSLKSGGKTLKPPGKINAGAEGAEEK